MLQSIWDPLLVCQNKAWQLGFHWSWRTPWGCNIVVGRALTSWWDLGKSSDVVKAICGNGKAKISTWRNKACWKMLWKRGKNPEQFNWWDWKGRMEGKKKLLLRCLLSLSLLQQWKAWLAIQREGIKSLNIQKVQTINIGRLRLP